jgi:uncharacterized membrane protein YgaE (UPF0421/DUF939 family)
MNYQAKDQRDLQLKKALDCLLAIAIGASLAVLIVVELSK